MSLIDFYTNSDEEKRLQRGNAENLEFITTVHSLSNLIKDNSKILEVGAGTGRYSFYYATLGHKVTAVDLVLKHIGIMQGKAESFDYKQNIGIQLGNATDLSGFDDEMFDVVLCLGPLYHLTNIEDRNSCIKESLRVLKKGGLLAVAYINKFFVFTYIAKQDRKYLTDSFLNKIVDKGFLTSDDEECFWTDSNYYTPTEIEGVLNAYNTTKIKHVGTDGISILLKDMVNQMNETEYKVWQKYHFATCEDPSILGYSNHGLYICRKD